MIRLLLLASCASLLTPTSPSVVKGGFCDGQVMDAAGIKSLSTMPNREGLLSMLAGSLNGIVGGLAVALQGIVDKQDETAA